MGKRNLIEWRGQVIDVKAVLKANEGISAKNGAALTRCLLAYFDEFSRGHQGGIIDGPIMEIKADVQRIAEVLFSDHFAEERRIRAEHQASMRERLPTKPTIPKHLRKAVFERDGFHCLKCGSKWELCADHIHPECRGGPTTLENLQTLCRKCNCRKSSKVEAAAGTPANGSSHDD